MHADAGPGAVVAEKKQLRTLPEADGSHQETVIFVDE
jgi:hypothetical protein